MITPYSEVPICTIIIKEMMLKLTGWLSSQDWQD
jgi:hypothetical protein